MMEDNLKNSLFPKKEFIVDGKETMYTSYLNFTISPVRVASKEKISFQCIFCNSENSCMLGATSNVKKHLENHKHTERFLKKWFDSFDDTHKAPHNKYQIDEETMKILKYFITRNTALSDFDDPSFRELLSGYKKPIPCSKTFSTAVLDVVVSNVRSEINSILEEAHSVCFISDIWTNKQMFDFMGLAANIININFEKETIVLGLEIMPGSHNAENIKKAIEDIANVYSFNKSILSGR